ncbi:MAG: CarD family transcriptional regulator [Clostridia bacterium]|nr:CarD family transcriptional regulator [Clostridia bacterium]
MLKIGETVQYSGNGVCVVDDIRWEDFGSGKMQYYILKPVSSGYNTFYIPIDNEKMLSKIRKVLTIDEVNEIIASMPESNTPWIENDLERKEEYKKIIFSGDCREIVKVIKAIHIHKESLKEQGRKLHLVDELMLKDAENLLYDEFAAVLNIKKEEVLPFIINSIEK